MTAPATRRTPSRAAQPRPRVPRELGIGLALFGLYVAVEVAAGPDRRRVADAHAWQLLHLEQRLGIDIEGPANRWLHPHRVLTLLADYEYAYTYVISAALLLVWVYLRRPESYRSVRNSFVALNVLGIGCFLLYPLTPPRLLPGLDLVDTVQRGHTVGSWGSPLVAHANQLAAMPSLHVGWALWVSVLLARLLGGRRVQALSAVHVAVTFLVIVATANHFVLDAVGGAIAVGFGVALADLWDRRPTRPGSLVPSADAFFWYVEADTAPQQVGGLGILDHPPDLDAVRARVADALPALPGFRRRVDPGTRWRRPRWVDLDEVDLAWHVTGHDLTRPTGGPADLTALYGYVAAQAASRMAADRPLWRVVIVRGLEGGRGALVLLAHHTIADGLGVVASALRFLDPPVPGRQEQLAPGPGRWRRTAGTVLGILQLATDGFCTAPLGDPRSSARRDFSAVHLDMGLVRHAARARGCAVTDVLLCAAAGALVRREPGLAARVGHRLRVAVPLLATDPGSATGNLTAAVMVDLPLDPVPEPDRLAAIAAVSSRRRTPARVLASRMVMAHVLALVPAPCARWFARSVYGHRSFHGIVSNMVGPDRPLRLVDAGLSDVVPILPLAPGAPLALGALGWSGSLGIGVATDPAVLSAATLAPGMVEVLRELATDGSEAGPAVHDSTGVSH